MLLLSAEEGACERPKALMGRRQLPRWGQLRVDDHIEHTKNMLDDMGQKWKHTTDQFETNRLFARARNPDDDSLAAGPGIFNLFKRQVNAYGELAGAHELLPEPFAAVALAFWA